MLRYTPLLITIIMATLFWNSLTQPTDTFSNTLQEHKNKSKISMTITYGHNKNISFFDDNQYENDSESNISPEVYEEILNTYEWSVSLPNYTDLISKRLDNYFNTNYNKKLITYLYDKEEDEWFDETDVVYDFGEWAEAEEEEEEEIVV